MNACVSVRVVFYLRSHIGVWSLTAYGTLIKPGYLILYIIFSFFLFYIVVLWCYTLYISILSFFFTSSFSDIMHYAFSFLLSLYRRYLKLYIIHFISFFFISLLSDYITYFLSLLYRRFLMLYITYFLSLLYRRFLMLCITVEQNWLWARRKEIVNPQTISSGLSAISLWLVCRLCLSRTLTEGARGQGL